jgi:hypothetical protein
MNFCLLQEIPENGADVAHLNAVHSSSLLSRLGEKYPILLNIIGENYIFMDVVKVERISSRLVLSSQVLC